MKKLLLTVLCLAAAVTLSISCGGDDETSYTDENTENVNVGKLIVGFWGDFNATSSASQNSTSQYTFASFNDNGDYAMYLTDDIFSSGTYTISDSIITLYDGYNGTSTSAKMNASNSTISITINGASYTGSKTTKDPIDLDYIFIGKSYTFYFYLKPTSLTFNTKYAATQEYQYTTTRVLSIYWQYVYDGYSKIYTKKYNDPNVHTLVGGYNTFTKGKVYIYNTEISNGSITNIELLNADE